MRELRLFWVVSIAAALAACTTIARNEIEGNNTGGVIPGPMIKSGNAASLASAHCAKYGAVPRITFEPSQAGGDVVFVCEAPAPPAPPAVKQPPTRQAPPGGIKQQPRTG
jgi:hypothetical protein